MSERIILNFSQYGFVRLKLREMLDARGMSRNALARSVGSRFEVIDKWYRGDIAKLDLDVLARICHVLGCGVSDLLEYADK